MPAPADSKLLSVPMSGCRTNHLLSCLSAHDYSLLEPHLSVGPLSARQVLQIAHEEIRHVYFPRSGIISRMVTFSDGRMAEAGVLGLNSAAGLSAIVGDKTALNLVTVQIAGAADKIETCYLAECAARSPTLSATIRWHEQALCAQAFQIAGCNAVHSAQERLCRWLLQCRDLLASDELPLTQEFLATLIGVRRASVTMIAGELERAGLISCRRGLVHLLRVEQLQDAACECYGAIKEQTARLTGWAPTAAAMRCA
jgi:CRP-like cAMP-binding protein